MYLRLQCQGMAEQGLRNSNLLFSGSEAQSCSPLNTKHNNYVETCVMVIYPILQAYPGQSPPPPACFLSLDLSFPICNSREGGDILCLASHYACCIKYVNKHQVVLKEAHVFLDWKT